MAIASAPYRRRADTPRATFTRRDMCLRAGAVVAACCLQGCATTGYQPRGAGSLGYEHSEIGPDTYEVRYRARLEWGKAGSAWARVEVLGHLRHRCAELALERGCDYFIVLRESGQESQPLGYVLQNLPLNLLGVSGSSSRYVAAATMRCFHGEAPDALVDEQGGPHPGEEGYLAHDPRTVLAQFDEGRDKSIRASRRIDEAALLGRLSGARRTAVEQFLDRRRTVFKWEGHDVVTRKPYGLDNAGFVTAVLVAARVVEVGARYWPGRLWSDFRTPGADVEHLRPGDLVFEANKTCWFVLDAKRLIGMLPNSGVTIADRSKLRSRIVAYGLVAYDESARE